MTGRRTSSPSTGLWTATITLLLFSASVRSQSASALNEAVPSPHAAAADSPSGSADSSLRKADSIVGLASTTSKSVDESPEASLDAVVLGEKIAAGNSTSNKLDEPKAQNEPVIKSGKPEELREIARVEEKSGSAGISQPEFSEKEDYDAHELEEESDREPTTPPTKKTNNESPEEAKEEDVEPNAGSSGERDVKDIERTKPEVGISLANDTNVNYNKKTAKTSKEDGTLENDSKGLKSALENATNVIASGEAADAQLEKGKGPKDQVEVVKNSTLPKVQRITASTEGAGDERKEVGNPGSAERDDNTEVPTIATPSSKDLGQKGKTESLTVSSSEVEAGKVEANGTLPTPKGRTISFGGTNEFVTDDNKTGDNGATNDQGIGVDITKETLQEHTNAEFKPYPYVKSTVNYPSNGSDAQLPLPKDREVPESTEEASALENTIGQRQQDKKFVVTEPSLVIDNSIQQFKPTYFKRSGNASRIQASLVSASSTTDSSLERDQSGPSMASTESAALENNNNTTAYIDSLRISNTENDVPRGKDEETKTSVGVKDTSGGLDLNGNGITEVVGGTKNNTVSMIDDFGFTKAPFASTASIARATEDSQVQNSTEQIATARNDLITTMDVQTDSGNSMLKISPLNVTEGSTRIPSTESATSLETSTPTLPTTSSMPNVSSSSTETEDLTTVAPEGSTNVVPQETLRPEESPTTDASVDSTTSKVEYEFVGLTESTVSQRYIASSESSNDLTDDREVVSSTSSFPDFSASSTVAAIYGISTPPGSTSMDSETTEAVTSIAETSTGEYSTTVISTLDFGASEETTTSMDDNSNLTTVLDDSSTVGTNESPDTTTEAIHLLANATNAPEVFTHGRENTTDTGRAVDPSTTSIPDASGTPVEIAGNSSGVLIATTESTNLSVTSEDPRMVLTRMSPEFDSTTNTPSTEATPEVEISSTPEEAIIIVTEGSTVGRAAVPSLVRIVFDGNWADVCPHLPALRQSLADLLTSGLEKTVLASQIIFQKNPCSDGFAASSTSTDLSATSLLLYVVDQNGNPDSEMTKMLPTLYSRSPIKLQVNIHSFQLVQDSDSGNAIAVVVVSCVAFICLVLLAGLLFIMRKRQTRFNYGERCRPVSLDAYSLDSVSAYNSVRRKGAARASKRSYGNPTFEDSSAIPSHPLNFAGLATFCNEQNIIAEEFSGIPQVTARIDELPPGAEVKNRYANVVPLPETRVSLMKINNDPLTEYINASYVRGPKNATKYYIACQAPIESTVTDFWRMIWEQQSKVIIMLTDLVENGVEKCAEYIPPSEVTDCHRLYGDFQVTLKKRETKEKYAISTLHLKNLENNTFREISHIWYLWPANGVQTDAAGLIAVLLEARALQRGGPGPIVVHCSPGTGRTGTLIALDLGIRQYEITRTVDVPRVVYTIRRDRAGSVQTKEQYAFIYKALNLYATKLAGGALES